MHRHVYNDMPGYNNNDASILSYGHQLRDSNPVQRPDPYMGDDSDVYMERTESTPQPLQTDNTYVLVTATDDVSSDLLVPDSIA